MMTAEQLARIYEKENPGYVCYAMYELTDQWNSICAVYKMQNNGSVKYEKICDGGTVINVHTGQMDSLLDHGDLMAYLAQDIDYQEQPVVIDRQAYEWVKNHFE